MPARALECTVLGKMHQIFPNFVYRNLGSSRLITWWHGCPAVKLLCGHNFELSEHLFLKPSMLIQYNRAPLHESHSSSVKTTTSWFEFYGTGIKCDPPEFGMARLINSNWTTDKSGIIIVLVTKIL